MSDLHEIPDTSEYKLATDAQATAADPNLSAWVAANAGSGKTKVLIDRVARLLLGGAAPGSILCVTYTKAAANEMLGRLFDRLGSWSVMPESKLRAELEKLDPATAAYGEEDLRRARALFARALETPGGLRIETIHAFCSRILRRFPLEANVAPGFQEIEDEDASELWDDAVKRAIIDAGRDAPDALATLSLAGGAFGAKGAMEALRGAAAAITAFAASYQNSDTAMANAVRNALRAPDADEETFIRTQINRLDWAALKAVVPVLLAKPAADDKRSAAALSAAIEAPTAREKWTALQPMFFTGSGSLRKRIFNAAAAKDPSVSELLAVQGDLGSQSLIIIETAAALGAIQAADRTIALFKTGLPALEHYGDLKADQAALDFDDLIIRTRDLLTQIGVAAWVLYKLDGGLEHVLLDEAQDTSPHQWTLINALTEEFFSGKGREHDQNPRTLFVVGDEKQSIYSFQGADPAKFISERQIFSKRSLAADLPHALPEMEMSFRSSPEILTFVDAVWNEAPNLSDAFAKDPPAEADITRHTARRINQPGFVEFWPIDIPQTESDENPWTPFSELKALDAMDAGSPKVRLAEKVASEIAAMVRRGDSVWQRQGQNAGYRRAMTPGDVLILVRKRKGGLFDALIKALKAKGLPVAGADRLVLADHIGVQDCLNLIRFALLPSDDLTLAEILRGPFCGLVDDDTHLFPLAHCRKGTLWESLQASELPAHAGAKVLMQRLIDQRDAPPYEFLSCLLEERMDGEETGWDKITYRLGMPARDPIEALLSRALAHDARNAASLQTFLADLESDDAEIKRDLEEAGGAVRVMTVHGAKGLQAPVVVLPDTTGLPDKKIGNFLHLDGGAVPIRAGKKNDDTLEMSAARAEAEAKIMLEHRRLLYVALTRAQDRLLICGPWHGTRPTEDKIPSGRPSLCWHHMCEAGLAALGKDIPGPGGAPVSFGCPPPIVSHEAAEHAPPSITPDWLHRDAAPETKVRRTIAPTALVPGDTPVLPPFRKGNGRRLSRGRLIHALLQRLPDIAPAEREAKASAFLASEPELTSNQRREMLAAAMAVLNDPTFSEVFRPGGRAEAFVIGSSPDLPDGTILNGRVDRLIVTDDEVLIIDFKTDRPPPSTPDGVGQNYIVQMAAYRAVLKQAYPDKRIRCALLWTDGPRLMELPENLLLEALNNLHSGV